MFKKKETEKSEFSDINTDMDMTKCFFIDISYNKKRLRTKCFNVKRIKGKNIELCIALNDTHDFMLNTGFIVEYNMLTGKRYTQSAVLIRKEANHIILELNEDLSLLEEKRKSIKVECELMGEVTYLNKNTEICINDICIGGVCFCSQADLGVGTIYSITIDEFLMKQKLKILRKTKNDSFFTYGCCFVELSSKNEEKLLMYINDILFKKRKILMQRDVYNYKF